MALLGNPDMIHVLRHSRRGAVLVASILSAALIVGCSSEDEDVSRKAKDPKPSAKPSVTSGQTKALEKKAEKALRLDNADDTDGLFVEAGLERVSDGIHTRSTLANGKSYTLAVVCSGVGKVRLTVTAKRPVRQTVECDSVPVRQRITDAPEHVETDVDGLAGSSGIIGGRIDELAK
ncbi:hypothetical protein [Streptomyces massasporeus]|uniref:hypothetical protein n=1 Tax=Streptomyces massasporeus TaxID=67324 RepID=UPI00332C2853